jgi:hypothetical protein
VVDYASIVLLEGHRRWIEESNKYNGYFEVFPNSFQQDVFVEVVPF